MTDLDKLFIRIDKYNLNSDTPNVVTIATTISEGVATNVITNPETISQFDAVFFQITVAGLSGGGSIGIQLNRPTYSPEDEDDYEFEFHAVPILGSTNVYQLNLSRALRAANKGMPFAVSASSALTYRLHIVDEDGSEYFTSSATLAICQTNLGDIPEDELDRAFQILNNLGGN